MAKPYTCRNELRRKMGILWEIVQTGLMYGQKRKSDSVEDRVQSLEDRLTATQNTLRSLVKKLEEMQGADIDGDGRIG
jgi:bisphosphoglycerate-dependent phosphoglycerate mutase